MASRGNKVTAREVAELPPEEWPEWYRPASGKPASGRPAEPFREGNTKTLSAGHRSPRVYGQVSAALAQGLLETRPDLAVFPEAVASWADAEARAALLRYDLDRVGMFDGSGEIRASRVTALDRFEKRAASERTKLGLDPKAELELALLRAKAVELGQLDERAKSSVTAIAETGRAALVEDALAKVREEGTDGPLSFPKALGDRKHAEPTKDALDRAQGRADTEEMGQR